MQKEKTIYISIPITGKDYQKQFNEAKMWQDHHERLGYKVINPFDLGKKLEFRHKRAGKPALHTLNTWK